MDKYIIERIFIIAYIMTINTKHTNVSNGCVF